MVADPWAEFDDAPPASLALQRMLARGVEPTSGFRNGEDVQRLKRDGYQPATNGAHNLGDGIDLVPGKSGLSLGQLQTFARKEFPNGSKVEVHGGTHVHIAVPDWGLAPDLHRADPWDAFKDAPTGQVHDGDTLKLSSGRNARLGGVDAWELAQQGRERDGSLVPLGRNARNALASGVSPRTTVFPTGEFTFGRPVVNLDNVGRDPAAGLLRGGHALAAPQYLQGDPRFGPYMESERQARANLLGGHGTNAETPTQFRRKDGPWQGAEPGEWGSGQAVFGDEPTPFMGLRPEIEQGYLAIWQDMDSKPEDLIAYATANGFTLDPSTVRARYAERNKPKHHPTGELEYVEPPRLLTDPGDGKVGTTLRGVGDPFNMIDELGGVADTLGIGMAPDGERESIWNSDRRFGDVLWNNIDQNRSVIAHDEATHPYYRLGGQLASGVALPYGGGVRTIGGLAKLGAAEGFAAGFGAGEGGITDRLPNAAVGTALGAGGGVVLGHLAPPVLGLASKGINAVGAGWRAGRRATGRGGQQEAPLAPVGRDAAPVADDGVQSASAAMRMEDEGAELVGPVARQRDRIDVGRDPWAEFRDAPFGVARNMDERLSADEMAKLAEGVDPASVLPRPGNVVGSLDEAVRANPGTIREPEAPDEFAELRVRKIPSRKDLYKSSRIRGPIDITQSIRMMGGVRDEGGDLASMGISNEPRRMDFGSNEQFLGKLVDNERGMSLDDATERLWEEGYFPEFGDERPTVNELLERLGDEHTGARRYFHPDDGEEVARFEAAQAGRYRIEEAANTGVPLAEQRGHEITLDDLVANEPPAGAYEDMPRLTGKVGNINLDRLEKPEQVAALIEQISQRVGGFSAASRGRITHDETVKLAQELGLRPEQLLKRRQGQALNAEQMVASRALVQRSREAVARLAKRAHGGTDDDVMGFRKAWLKHVALEEQVAGATAEAGRALSAGRILARAQDSGAAAVRAYLKGAGGRESIEEAAEAIVDLMEDPAKASHFMRESVKPRWRDKFNELWINSLLSGPRTHVVNFVGNSLTTALSFPEQAMTAAIGKVTRSADRAYFGEVGARAVGLADSSVEALRNMRQAFKSGEAVDETSKVEAVHQKAIGGRTGEIIRIPTRALTAADEFWKALLRSAELRQLAYRQAMRETGGGDAFAARYESLLRAPPEGLDKQAHTAARYYTFQKPLGEAGRGIQQVSNNWVGGKLLLPFVRTPINLIKFAGERSVFGLAMPEVRAALKAGGRSRDEALAKITLGSGLSTAAVVGALEGRITGSGPSDPRERAALLQAGWQPNSIRIGDQWVSYARFDPVSTLIGVAADFAEAGAWATKKEADVVAMNLAMGIAKNITNKTWLSGLSDAFDVLSDPERYGKGYVQRLAGSAAVPAIASQSAQALDPHLRDARTVMDAIKRRVPVLSQSVPVRRNVWGEPVSSGDAVGPDILSPFYASMASNDPFRKEIARLRAPLAMPRRYLTIEGRRVNLGAKQYDELVQLTGQPAKQYLEQQVGSPEWRSMNDGERRELVKETLAEFRAAGRDALLANHPELAGKPPRRSVPANDTWGEFNDAR
jgi:hypothetical protein